MSTTNIEEGNVDEPGPRILLHRSLPPKSRSDTPVGALYVYAANRRAQRMLRFDIFAFVSRLFDSPAVHCTPAAMG